LAFRWRSLETHRGCRQKAGFPYEKRDRLLTTNDQIKSVISGF
jgi:hypothetical protein